MHRISLVSAFNLESISVLNYWRVALWRLQKLLFGYDSVLQSREALPHFIQHRAEGLVLLLTFINGQLVIDDSVRQMFIDVMQPSFCATALLVILSNPVDGWELQDVSYKQYIHSTKPLIPSEPLAEAEVNVRQV